MRYSLESGERSGRFSLSDRRLVLDSDILPRSVVTWSRILLVGWLEAVDFVGDEGKAGILKIIYILISTILIGLSLATLLPAVICGACRRARLLESRDAHRTYV